jgi:hypothetical protein
MTWQHHQCVIIVRAVHQRYMHEKSQVGCTSAYYDTNATPLQRWRAKKHPCTAQASAHALCFHQTPEPATLQLQPHHDRHVQDPAKKNMPGNAT